MQILSAPPKPFSWSFSAVDNFHTCGLKYYHQVVVKDVSDQTVYRSEGQQVHTLMNDRLMHARPLPPHMRHWDRWIDELLEGSDRTQTILRGEQKLAFTFDFEPCDYFDRVRKVWWRGAIDAMKIVGDTAIMRDWKTGKMKPDADQLLVYATAIFIHFPVVKKIQGALVFLKEDTGRHIPRGDCIYELLIERSDLPPFWQRYEHKVNALRLAHDTDTWPALPSGLCRNHCAVHSCEHNGHHGE
jgi:hypothetical protein